VDIDLELDCPQCGRRVKATTADLAKQRTVACPSGHRLNLKDEGGGARKVQRSLDDLDKAIKKLGK
jgi:DNA-directed RNA polymerase subunit RPC12/RpoP